jgi:hypothetical protein
MDYTFSPPGPTVVKINVKYMHTFFYIRTNSPSASNYKTQRTTKIVCLCELPVKAIVIPNCVTNTCKASKEEKSSTSPFKWREICC